MAATHILRPRTPFPTQFTRLIVPGTLFLPACLLMVASLRAPEVAGLTLWIGTAVQGLVCIVALLGRRGDQLSIGSPLIIIYLTALGWLWLGTRGAEDWYVHLAQAILLMLPVTGFGLQMLASTGVLALRRARRLAARLAARRDLSSDPADCRARSEVKALREALYIDASPALALLNHPRLPVRVAALSALECRLDWVAGQPEVVLQFLQRAQEPEARTAAVLALAAVNDQVVVEALAEFLRDPVWEVRRAAADALLRDTTRRWGWIRHAMRHALSDVELQNDGPLQQPAQPLSADAIADLTAWTAEKGVLGIRASLTLAAYYGRTLNDRPDPHLIADLRERVANQHTPPPLRLELARLLHANRELDRSLLEKLILPENPASLRLLAVEALLAEREHPEAPAVLRDLARLPNREIALATAVAVQRRLGVNLGLNLAEPLPPLHSRQAADITRRVMKWAAQHDVALRQAYNENN